ncbi:MAG TPA: hypothetical protein VI911_00975 [Patescibacteria group bacterium]|nr:hypothetical protein [Patescibacteria group bacterium]
MSDKNKKPNWTNCKDCVCPKCKGGRTQCRENDRGDFEHRCLDCKNTWWIDGADY